MESTKIKIREFLNRFFKKRDITDEEDIFELGFVNSLFAMQLVMFVEKEFDIALDTNDIDLSNFRTINQIASLIDKKTAN